MAALFAGVLVLWSTAALRIAVTSLLALALQPLFRLTSLVADRPPTTGAIFGAAVANFMSSVFFFVLVMFAIALAWIVRTSDCRPRTRATSKFGTVQAATRAGAHS